MQKKYEELLKSFAFLIGLCGVFHLINVFFINTYYTAELIHEPFFIIAIIAIIISVILYVLIKKEIDEGKIKANNFKITIIAVFDVFLIFASIIILFTLLA